MLRQHLMLRMLVLVLMLVMMLVLMLVLMCKLVVMVLMVDFVVFVGMMRVSFNAHMLMLFHKVTVEILLGRVGFFLALGQVSSSFFPRLVLRKKLQT